MFILDGLRKGIDFVCLSQDESLVASAVRGAGEAVVWSLETASVVQTCGGVRRINGIAFSGEGDVLRGHDAFPRWNLAWRIDDGRFTTNTPGDYEMDELCRGRPLDVQRFGADERQRVVVHGDNWLNGRDRFGMNWGQVRRVGPGWQVGPHSDTGKMHTVVVRPEESTLPGEPLDTLPEDVGRCWGVAITDDGRHVALGFESGLVYVHDFVADTEVGRWNWDLGRVKALAFSPDGQAIVAGGVTGIAVWDPLPRHEPSPTELGLLAAVAAGEPNAVGVHSDYLEDQGLPRWDRYSWADDTPLRLHAESVLRAREA